MVQLAYTLTYPTVKAPVLGVVGVCDWGILAYNEANKAIISTQFLGYR